jgi:hypothetical protein
LAQNLPIQHLAISVPIIFSIPLHTPFHLTPMSASVGSCPTGSLPHSMYIISVARCSSKLITCGNKGISNPRAVHQLPTMASARKTHKDTDNFLVAKVVHTPPIN